MSLTLIDTNILVYAHDPDEPAKQRVAADSLEQLRASGNGRLSTQVLAELFVVVRRSGRLAGLADGVAAQNAQALVDAYAQTFSVVVIPVAAVSVAADAVVRRSLAFWDALIWATAHAHRIESILTEDGPSGAEIDGIRYVNPF